VRGAESHATTGASGAVCGEFVSNSESGGRAEHGRVAARETTRRHCKPRLLNMCVCQGATNRFVVHDVGLFCEAVLPRFYQHANWTSFTRQLANYNFVHVRDTDDAWIFEHPHFARDNATTHALVVRRKTSQSHANQHTAIANDVDGGDSSDVVAPPPTRLTTVVPCKRTIDKSSAATVDAGSADPHSTELVAQHHALLQSLHTKLDVQSANQELVLQSQARIVELLEAQERRVMLRQLDARQLEFFCRFQRGLWHVAL
jgi:hypothetical protein